MSVRRTGSHQTTLVVPSVAVRTAFASPVEMTLSPALTHEVTILSDGRPVEDAHVAALGTDFEVHGLSDQDGKVELRLPARGRLQELVAWHPKLGVNGVRDLEKGLPRDTTRLSLLAPGPHRVRVVDLDGNPIDGLELGVGLKTEDSDWIVSGHIEAAHVRTDAEGMAIIPWAPREKLKYVEVEIIGTDWKIDETDLARIAEGITTVHARRERTVEGRLVMPEGADAEGILITRLWFRPGEHRRYPVRPRTAGRDVHTPRPLGSCLCAGHHRSQVGQRPLVGHDPRQGHVEARRDHHEGLSRNATDGPRDARAAARSGRRCLD